jgi:hypothetical protein
LHANTDASLKLEFQTVIAWLTGCLLTSNASQTKEILCFYLMPGPRRELFSKLFRSNWTSSFSGTSIGFTNHVDFLHTTVSQKLHAFT